MRRALHIGLFIGVLIGMSACAAAAEAGHASDAEASIPGARIG